MEEGKEQQMPLCFTFFTYNLLVMLLNMFLLAMYFIQFVVEHYQCNTKTGINITIRVEIGITLGFGSLVFEILNAHVLLVYARLKLFKDIRKLGFY